jgi:hypothetical protein
VPNNVPNDLVRGSFLSLDIGPYIPPIFLGPFGCAQVAPKCHKKQHKKPHDLARDLLEVLSFDFDSYIPPNLRAFVNLLESI